VGKGVGKIASKYARALLSSVENELGVQATGEGVTGEGRTPAQNLASDLSLLAQSFNSDRDLHNALLSPMFPEAQRISALKALSDAYGLPPMIKNFLKLMFERGRLPALGEVSQAFSELADKAAKVVVVEITTARSVGNEEQAQIATSLSRAISGRLQFEWSVDPSILGGMLVKYSGSVLDGTIKSSLMRVEHSLLQ